MFDQYPRKEMTEKLPDELIQRVALDGNFVIDAGMSEDSWKRLFGSTRRRIWDMLQVGTFKEPTTDHDKTELIRYALQQPDLEHASKGKSTHQRSKGYQRFKDNE